jgi:hypothetical protein
VVAGQEEDRDVREAAQDLHGPQDGLSIHLVVVEDVPGDHDGLSLDLLGKPADGRDRLETVLTEPVLRPWAQEVTSHAELPVGGVHESQDVGSGGWGTGA